MRIIKYVFFLIILGLVAATIFIATQKGNYSVERSRFIKSPRNTVYNYLSDYGNYDQWGFWTDDSPDAVIKISEGTGKGSFYSWKTPDQKGRIQTMFVREGDSITQKVDLNGNESMFYWKLKDSVGGTKVIWRATGRLGFMEKIDATLMGGINYILGNQFESSLVNLDNNLDFEINTFKIDLNGVVQIPAAIFLKHTINSKITEHPKNLRIMLAKMHKFFAENDLKINGNPFVIYHSYNTDSGITKFSVCMPLAEEILTAQGSDLLFDRHGALTAVQSTLTGDYSHLQKTWSKNIEYLQNSNLQRSADMVAIEVMKVGTESTKQPSKWVTQVLVPIVPPVVRDSTVVTPARPITRAAPVTPAIVNDAATD